MKAVEIPGLFPVFDAAATAQLKADGISRALGLERQRESIRRHLEVLAGAGAPFTSDDVYRLAAEAGEPLGDRVQMGAVFHAAARQGLIEPMYCPSVPSKRPSSHGAGLKVWVGVLR